MKKTKVKAFSKVNFTLDVVGVKNGFHELRSLVSSIDLFDTITLKKRKDKNIVLIEKGIPCGCEKEKNNAYKTAKRIIELYNLDGITITINKRIPVGGGLGGSSADVAGVINGMKKLYNLDEKVYEVANELGSDCYAMLKTGFSIMSGRGDKVERLSIKKAFNLLIIKDDRLITAKECYSKFDELEKIEKVCTEKAVDYLKSGKDLEFIKECKNDLYNSSKIIYPILEDKILDLMQAGAINALMSGSGACVYGIFNDKRSQNTAYKLLKEKYNKNLIKAKTI
jgi:4-diphosphocytidyl-2-C-methyl-D-erythritol kinase